MKKLLTILLVLFSFSAMAQPCADEDTVRINAVTLITATSARVNGSISHFTSGYTTLYLQYVRVGQTDTATASGVSPLRNLTGLQPNTQYYYYYKTICVSGTNRQIGPYYFTTAINTVVYATERSTVFPYVKGDSGFKVPRQDTSLFRAPNTSGGDIVFKTSNSTMYYYNGTRWTPMAVDSGGYLALLNNKVDSVTVDSVTNRLYYWKMGVSYGYALPLDSAYVDGIAVNDSTLRFYRLDGDSSDFVLRGTAGGATGTVTSVATTANTGLLGGTITTSGTLYIDTLLVSTRAWRQKGMDSLLALIGGGSSYYQTVQNAGVSQTQRTKLNFGNEFLSSDNAGNNSSDITIASIAQSKITGLIDSLNTKLAKRDSITQYVTPTQLKDSLLNFTPLNTRNITYIKQPTTGSAIASGWTAVGSPSYTVSNGKFVWSGGANNLTQYIRNDLGVLAEGVTLESYVIINTKGTTDQGPRIGWDSYGSGNWDVNGGFVTGTSATGAGKVVLYSFAGALQYSDSAISNFADGDTLYYRLTRVGVTYTMLVENLTKDWKLTKTIVSNSSSFIAHGSAYVAVYPGAGAYTTYGLTYTINAPVFTDLMVVGNSITYLQSASSEAARYAQRIGVPSLNIASGGGADQIADVYNRLGEIIAIKPHAVTLMIGGNNILFAGSLTTQAKTDYIAIRDSLVNNGIKVIHLLPTPRAGTDLRPLVAFIDTSSTFRSDVIVRGTWYDLLDGTYGLKTQYDWGDGTHPNDAGMSAIAAVINDSLHYPNGSAILPNKNVIAKNGYLWGTDAGTGYNQFKAGGLIAQKFNQPLSYTQIGYVNNTGYIQPLTEGSAYENITINPSGGNIGLGTEAHSSYRVAVNSIANFSHVNSLILNRNNTPSSAGDENRLSFSLGASVEVSRIASYWDGLSNYGNLGFLTYNGGGMNSTYNLDMKGDLSNYFNGKLTVSDTLFATGKVKFSSLTTGVAAKRVMADASGNLYLSDSAVGAGNNLANTDLAQTAATRVYTIGYGVSDRALIFGSTSHRTRALLYNSPSTQSGLFEFYADDSISTYQSIIAGAPNDGVNRFSIGTVSQKNYLKQYKDSSVFSFQEINKLRYNLGKDSFLIKGNIPISASSTDSVLVRDNNGVIKLRAQSDIAGGGGGSGTVNSGNQYRLAYYATTGTAVSEAAAITASRALISDANGVPTHSVTTATEISFVNGVTSAIQTQLDSKLTYSKAKALNFKF